MHRREHELKELGKPNFPAHVHKGNNRLYAPMAEEAHEWYEQVLDGPHVICTSTAWLSVNE